MKIGYNVNNSISHPPHPRRAVPANLPPGAFFFLMGIFKKSLFIALVFSSPFSSFLYGVDDVLAQKIAELRLKSSAHGRFVNELLANELEIDPIKVPPPSISSIEPLPPEKPPTLPSVYLPTLDSYSSENDQAEEVLPEEVSKEVESIEQREVGSVPQSTETSTVPASDPPLGTEELTAYEDLYAPKTPQRRIGYYFGPFIGPVFPDDSAVRTGIGKESYHSDSGVTAGLRIGNDFGATRIEGEYGFTTHGIDDPSSGGSGKVQIHNLQSRFILEKTIGERTDLRGGIGLGLSFIEKSFVGENYDGVGFSYDFLLGWSFRVMENWSIHMDYRHYLTAAHKNYDRLQGHVVELSAGFDL